MVYIFRFLLPQEKKFMAEIAVPSSFSFFDLHQTVQEFFKYDKGQMASFIITDDHWHKLQEIAMVDFEKEGEESPMKAYKLSAIFSKKGQRMLYVFDFFSERAYFVQLSEIQEDKSISKGIMLKLEGKIPDQIKIDLDFPDVDEEEDEYDFDDFNDLRYGGNEDF